MTAYSLFESGEESIEFSFDFIESSGVFNGGRNDVFLLVHNFADSSTNDLATAGLWKAVHDYDTEEAAESSNISADFQVAVILNLVEFFLGLAI